MCTGAIRRWRYYGIDRYILKLAEYLLPERQRDYAYPDPDETPFAAHVPPKPSHDPGNPYRNRAQSGKAETDGTPKEF